MHYVYMLRCTGGSLYTGTAADVALRFSQHLSGRSKSGAKYTAAHPPLRVEAVWSVQDRSSALKLESRIKSLTHRAKEQLVSGELEAEYAPCSRVNVDESGHLI